VRVSGGGARPQAGHGWGSYGPRECHIGLTPFGQGSGNAKGPAESPGLSSFIAQAELIKTTRHTASGKVDPPLSSPT